MRKILPLLLVTCLSTLPVSVRAQAHYLPAGANGLTFTGGFASSEGATFLGAYAGIITAGRFAAGVSIGASDYGSSAGIEQLKSNSTSLEASVLLAKQGSGAAFSWAFFGSWDNEFFDSPSLSRNGVELSAEGFTFGTGLFYELALSGTTALVPGFSYRRSSWEVEASAYGYTDTEDDASSGTAFSLALLFGRGEGGTFILRPRVSRSSGSTAFGLVFGLVLPTGGGAWN